MRRFLVCRPRTAVRRSLLGARRAFAAPAESEAGSQSKTMMMAAGGGAVVLLLGGLAAWQLSGSSEAKKEEAPAEPAKEAEPAETAKTEPEPEATAEPAAAAEEKAAPSEGDSAELAALDQRIKELEIFSAEHLHSAFVFIKPHAVTDKVKTLVKERFALEGIGIRSEGAIAAEKIDQDMLIDTHYGAIAARAMKQKPDELAVQPKAKEAFKEAFGQSWEEALSAGIVYNLVDGAQKLGCSMDELGDKYDTLKKGKDLIKFGGGFYCGKVGEIFVINGFYARMRSQFTVPGECIYYYEVEWNPSNLAWGDFRGKVLGGTDPKTADESSLRHAIFKKWQDLDLTSEPNTGNNGLHASASPFEALAERANWLSVPVESDFYGKAMMALGIPKKTILEWGQDPAVSYEGKKQSLFDLLEDLDSSSCLKKGADIYGSK
mmetsp:Transcript_376/g.843  ORF Transcript_376/g.843 Transcript_376/m.843 type:complete len:434 (+) Transcript_376:80-1381(+)